MTRPIKLPFEPKDDGTEPLRVGDRVMLVDAGHEPGAPWSEQASYARYYKRTGVVTYIGGPYLDAIIEYKLDDNGDEFPGCFRWRLRKI